MAIKLTIGVIIEEDDKEPKDSSKSYSEEETQFFIENWIMPYKMSNAELATKDLNAETICMAMVGHMDVLIRNTWLQRIRSMTNETGNMELAKMVQRMEKNDAN